jgi:hypothetical protein
MNGLLHAQMDLFASPARLPELTSSERQRAVALLGTLLLEALTNPADAPSKGDEKEEAGNE